MRGSDESYRWFLARYNPVRDDEGQIIRWYIACADIDDRKREEDCSRYRPSGRKFAMGSSGSPCNRRIYRATGEIQD
jgi:hypothetical protein